VVDCTAHLKEVELADIDDLFNELADGIEREFSERRNLLSFGEYLQELEVAPRRHLRDSSRYLLDAIDFFGSERIERPWGQETRLAIFDQEFSDEQDRLVGQEEAQRSIRAAVASQVRDGEVNRLIVIHGPNGSAKSTLVRCLFSGLDHYSRQPEGELFRYRWIFPTRKNAHGASIGFGSRLKRDNLESFAHLGDEEIDATLECEVRDHPLLLLPREERMTLMRRILDAAGYEDYQIPEHFKHASLCHRCRQVADALMRTHKGDIKKVLAHVQVERWAMSRRYRRGTVLVGPRGSAR
jgi:serine protein kinase